MTRWSLAVTRRTIDQVRISDPVDKDVPPTMLPLPPLAEGRVSWKLPLSDTVAVSLSESFLVGDDEARTSRMAVILREDPSLALWTISRAWLAQHRTFHEIGGVAQWLSQHFLDALVWTNSGGWDEYVESESRVPDWSDLVASSVLVARRAAQLASNQDQRRTTYFFGLMQSARHWFRVCRSTGATGSDGNDACLIPSWWANCWDETIASARTSESALQVQQALAWASRDSSAAEPNGRIDDRQDALDVARRWALPLPAARRLLPSLIQTLSRMRQLETGYQETLEREKLDAMKELAYGAGHEINNPLANIATRAQALLREERDPERRRKLAAINSQAFRAHEMVADLMLFACPPQIRPEPLDIAEAIDAAIAETNEDAIDRQTKLVQSTAARPIVICGDRTQLIVAIKALIQNALEAVGRGGQIEISVHKLASSMGGSAERVALKVRDTGPGLPPETRRHLFDPFYSGREAGRGLGFGLSKCWRIVTQHGGWIDVESELGQGAVFTIWLPVLTPSDELSAAADAN